MGKGGQTGRPDWNGLRKARSSSQYLETNRIELSLSALIGLIMMLSAKLFSSPFSQNIHFIQVGHCPIQNTNCPSVLLNECLFTNFSYIPPLVWPRDTQKIHQDHRLALAFWVPMRIKSPLPPTGHITQPKSKFSLRFFLNNHLLTLRFSLTVLGNKFGMSHYKIVFFCLCFLFFKFLYTVRGTEKK